MTAAADVSYPRARRRVATWLDRRALTDVAPVLVALTPFALLIGVQVAAGRDVAGGLSGSLLLYAGSAQVSTLTLLEQGAGVASMLATVALVNARFLVYSATLAPRFADQPGWFRWLGPHFIVDQTFGLVSARDDLDEPTRFRRYWLTAALAIAVVWVGAMSAGVGLGPAVPRSPATTFMPVAVLVGLLVPALRDRPSVASAAAGCAVAALAPSSPGVRVLLGTATGAVVGLLMERAAR